MKLFLFDLDGTLVTTGGAGLRALDKSFAELFAVKDTVKEINPSGKTDPAIFREMAQRFLKRDLTAGEGTALADTYLTHLEKEMEISTKKNALTGVMEFLDHLSDRTDILRALGTGNLEKGARIKLAPMKLNPYFSFGGFGSDAEERAEVLRFGQRRAEQKTGRSISATDVYVIGDTTLDIAAARKAGFRAIGVASGGVSYADLSAAKPDYLWRDMKNGFEFLKTLT